METIEDVCSECGGTGVIEWEHPNEKGDDMVQEKQKCVCQIDDSDMSGATPGER